MTEAKTNRPETPAHLRRDAVDRLYAEQDYMTAYRTHTDLRVLHDPHAAVGSMWEEIGTLQFDYLVRNGLEPHHRMLDVGCGTLRGGRHFIRFLDAGRYTGLDISPRALEYAGRLVAEEGLADKRPAFVLDRDMRLRFEELDGSTFDCILAQSVFTHLPEELIAECFAHVGRVMHGTSRFFFTFVDAQQVEKRTAKDFSYPFALFERLAAAHGFGVARRDDYGHPRSQVMAVLTKPA